MALARLTPSSPRGACQLALRERCAGLRGDAVLSCVQWRLAALALSPSTWRGAGGSALKISAVGWDPEGILSGPQPGHITRRKMQRSIAEDNADQEKAMAAARAELERRRATREARAVPEGDPELLEFFLNTEVQEMEYEVARCRPRLTPHFFSVLRAEAGALRFAVEQTEERRDRLAELEALEKVLKEALEAYDSMADDLLGAKEKLTTILSAKDKRAAILQLAADSQLDRPLLALLDQNIAAAQGANEAQAAEFMEKVRSAVVKYITL